MKISGWSYKKKVLYLIAVLFILRCIVASVLELGNDEAYYWLYGQHLQWNYFDHPPIVAFCARLFTVDLLLQDYEVFLRLGSITCCAFSTWFLYRTLSILHSERAGFFAACLYNASFYAGLTAGVYLMPDAPQMLFWTGSLWMIARINVDEHNWTSWIVLGIAAGFSIMSKVHGVFIWTGLGLFILFQKRAWLTKPQLYVALIITALIVCPILIWNIEHDFVTYRFHSKRVTIEDITVNHYSFLKELAGQVYFNNPVNVGLIVWGLINWYRKRMERLSALAIYQFIGLPLALLLLFISFFRDTTLPHWNGPAYVSLLPLAAVQLAQLKTTFPKLVRGSLAVFFLTLTGWMSMVYFYPGTIGSKHRQNLGEGDISLDMYGWREASKQFAVFYQNEVEEGIVPASTPLVCGYWWGAHLEYYFSRPLGIQMIGLGPMHQLRHYLWMNNQRKDKVDLSTAYCIIVSDEDYQVPVSFYSIVELAKVIEVKRNGQPAHDFRVYRLRGWKGAFPAVH